MRALLHTEFAALLGRTGTSQASFARIAGFSPRQVNNWCRGRAAVPPWTAALAVLPEECSSEAVTMLVEEAALGLARDPGRLTGHRDRRDLSCHAPVGRALRTRPRRLGCAADPDRRRLPAGQGRRQKTVNRPVTRPSPPLTSPSATGLYSRSGAKPDPMSHAKHITPRGLTTSPLAESGRVPTLGLCRGVRGRNRDPHASRRHQDRPPVLRSPAAPPCTACCGSGSPPVRDRAILQPGFGAALLRSESSGTGGLGAKS